MKLSIVTPVYNSEKILPSLAARIDDFTKDNHLAGDFELILVNDASPDNSWQVIKRLSSEYYFLRGICLRKNFGQHCATMAGLKHACGDTVVIMDDDLQHPPEEILNLMREIENGADVCYANYKNRRHASWKIWGSKLNDWAVTKLMNKPKGLYLSSFKAISSSVVAEIIKYEGPYTYIDGLILSTTNAIRSIDIEHQTRLEGKSNYNLKRSISLFFNMVTSFSIVPLRLAIYIGFFITIISFILIVFIIIEKLLNPGIAAGWTSLIATILFIGGVQTFCIGMVGEYLGRSYLKINNKPQFVIKEMTDNG
jgi:polyisoprenyl-phosphate glycosyltransferase